MEHLSQHNYIKLFDKSCASFVLDNTVLDLKELGAQVALFHSRLYTEPLYLDTAAHEGAATTGGCYNWGLPQLRVAITGGCYNSGLLQLGAATAEGCYSWGLLKQVKWRD